MTYKESLTNQMNSFARDPLARFVGYGLLNGKGGNGTMKEIPNDKIYEVTVAENLMMGMAMGLALKGLRPMVILERFDFIGNCFDYRFIGMISYYFINQSNDSFHIFFNH